MRAHALGRLLALVAIAAIVAAGLCLLDAHSPGGADLCGAFLATTIGLLLAAPVPIVGRLVPVPATGRPRSRQDLLAPPPRA